MSELAVVHMGLRWRDRRRARQQTSLGAEGFRGQAPPRVQAGNGGYGRLARLWHSCGPHLNGFDAKPGAGAHGQQNDSTVEGEMVARLKELVRRVVNHLPSPAESPKGPPQPVQGREMPSFYYDEAFNRKPDFQVPFYKAAYYPTWLLVVDRLRRYGCERLLDVGCGPGQFAQLCDDWGFESYVGLDFSPVALEMARAKAPRFVFRQGDIREKTTYEGLDFNAIVCMEVLEHLEDDAAVLSCFPAGVRCLMTVPNFPYRSHVRHFESEQAVTARYGHYFTEFHVRRLKGVRADTEQFYLIDGVRNGLIEPGRA